MSEYHNAVGNSIMGFLRGLQYAALREHLNPVRIKKDGRVTVVFWSDGTATSVKCSMDEKYDSYTAFCAALGKKVFGSNSVLKRVIQNCPVAVIDPVLLDPDGCPASSQIADMVMEQPRVYSSLSSSSTFTVHESDIAYPDMP